MLQQIWATRGASNQGTRAFPFRPSDASACSVRLTQEDKLARLRWVVQRTGSKVVLSTDWRRDPDLKHRLIQTLKTYEVEVIGATLKGPQLQPVRPREISAWLDGYEAERRFHSQQPVCAWVAVDDRLLVREDGGEALDGHFVHTAFATGLTIDKAERMAAILLQDTADSITTSTSSSPMAKRSSPEATPAPSPAPAAPAHATPSSLNPQARPFQPLGRGSLSPTPPPCSGSGAPSTSTSSTAEGPPLISPPKLPYQHQQSPYQHQPPPLPSSQQLTPSPRTMSQSSSSPQLPAKQAHPPLHTRPPLIQIPLASSTSGNFGSPCYPGNGTPAAAAAAPSPTAATLAPLTAAPASSSLPHTAAAPPALLGISTPSGSSKTTPTGVLPSPLGTPTHVIPSGLPHYAVHVQPGTSHFSPGAALPSRRPLSLGQMRTALSRSAPPSVTTLRQLQMNAMANAGLYQGGRHQPLRGPLAAAAQASAHAPAPAPDLGVSSLAARGGSIPAWRAENAGVASRSAAPAATAAPASTGVVGGGGSIHLGRPSASAESTPWPPMTSIEAVDLNVESTHSGDLFQSSSRAPPSATAARESNGRRISSVSSVKSGSVGDHGRSHSGSFVRPTLEMAVAREAARAFEVAASLPQPPQSSSRARGGSQGHSQGARPLTRRPTPGSASSASPSLSLEVLSTRSPTRSPHRSSGQGQPSRSFGSECEGNVDVESNKASAIRAQRYMRRATPPPSLSPGFT